MNLIAIGFAGFLAFVILGVLLSPLFGFKPIWATSTAKQDAADAMRKDRIFRG